MWNNYVKPTRAAWFFFITGLITTLALGTWQVQRLQWKTALIAEIEAAHNAAPITELPKTATAMDALEFRRVQLQGAWLGSHEFHIAARYFKGEMGYHILTPFQLSDGRIVLVNRGWVPSAKKELATRPDTAVADEATITGMVRIGADRNYFTPLSQPAKNMWFGRDVAQMAASAKLENVIPELSIDVIGVQDKTRLPVAATGEVHLRNDHLSYVITWYGIALGMLVIFRLAHRKKP